MSAAGRERKGAAPGREPPANAQIPAKVSEERLPPTVTLRNRRDAALRLPPLEGGVRDPLDKLAGLPAARLSEENDVVTLGLCCAHGDDCPAKQGAR